MSARTPFFPPRAPSRAAFAADPSNPLHTGNLGDLGSTVPKSESFSLNAPTSIAGKPMQTSGLGGIRKKRSSTEGGAIQSPMSTGHEMRPGTADPHGRVQYGRRMAPPDGQIAIMAPTPQNKASPAFLSREANSSGFLSRLGKGSMVLAALDSSENANENSVDMGQPLPLNFRSSGNSNGPQRVLIEPEPSQYRGKHETGEATLPGHEFTENGSLRRSSTSHSIKRMRQDDDDDEEVVHEHLTKRVKAQEQLEVEGNLARSRTFSPNTERPSSGHSYTSERRQGSEVRDSSHAHRQIPTQRQSFQPESPARVQQQQLGSGMESRYEGKVPLEPKPLEKLLGRDADAFVQEHMETYDALVTKWSNCTMAEWISGAEEISAGVGSVLDFVKEYMDRKIKTYSNFDNTIKMQENVLQERKRILESTRTRVIKQSGSTLG